MPKPYRWVCEECGSDNVSTDATARWDYGAQEWEISALHDGEFCDDCEGETRLEIKFDGDGDG